MTTTPPGVPPASPPPASGDGSGRRRDHSRLVAALLAVGVGLIAFVGSGLGGFAAAGGLTGATVEAPEPVGLEPVDCGEHSRCVPSLMITDVARALADEGHICLEIADVTLGQRDCTLEIGRNRYEARLVPGDEDKDRISQVGATVSHGTDQLLRGGRSYLTWLAVLPFTADPETTDEITQWIGQHQEGREDVRIGPYDYSLWTDSKGTYLRYRPAPEPGSPPGFPDVPLDPDPYDVSIDPELPDAEDVQE